MKNILWFDWEEKIKSCLRKVADSADKKRLPPRGMSHALEADDVSGT